MRKAPQHRSTAAPPATGTTSASEPCGNPEPSGTPICKKCEDGEWHYYTPAAGSSCDTNSIRSYNGNAHRKITDLRIAGSVGKMPLAFERYSNTRLSSRNFVHSAFGIDSSWSHNFEWVMRDNGGTVDRPIIKITYPQGDEMRFQRWSATSSTWLPTNHRNPDRIVSTSSDFVLHTGNQDKFAFKRRIHSVNGGVFYRLEGITDSESNTKGVSYLDNDDTLIRQITDAAGHWIKLHYNDLSVRSNGSVVLSEQLLPTGSTGVWKEINLTPGTAYRILALYQGNTYRQAVPLQVAELEFYDENNVKINGTVFGSWPWATNCEPAKAFDGNTGTHYKYAYEKAGHVGIDLGAGNAKQVSRIRFRLSGTLNSDAAVTFVGMNNELIPNHVVSHVEGSDGREVGYDYNIYTEPSGLFQWVQLAAANYTDLTASAYTYKWQHRHVMPVLETANDPRYGSPVKQVRYGYDLNTVVGFVSDEYDQGSGQLVASVRWDGAYIPKLVYPNGKANRFEYTDGNLMRAINSFGGVTDYTYTWNGFVLTEDDSLGRKTIYTRNSEGRVLSVTTPAGSVTNYTRDAAHYVTGVSVNGKATGYELDSNKRRTRTNHPDGTYETWSYNSYGQKLTHRLRNGTSESWFYDAAGLLTQHVDPAGTVTEYAYNALNRLASETRRLDPVTAYTTLYEYDDRGSLTKITRPDGFFVQHSYDDYGNRVATLDERGQLTERTYDSLSRMLTETDPNGYTTAYNYTSSLGGGCGCNTGGLPVTITYPDGTVTLNTYDKEWRLLSTTHAFGAPEAATTRYAYDVAGQRTSMTDPLGRLTTYGYDADGRLISETRAFGTRVAVTTRRTNSPDGNLLSVTEGLGSPAATTTTMEYDVMDRVTSTTVADGTIDESTTSSFYNTLGQLATTTDPLGRITRYDYDAAGRQTDTTLPDGTLFRSEYDAFSRVVRSIAAVGLLEQAITATIYDSRDRAVTRTDPTGVTTVTAYDGGGLPTSVTLSSGKSVDFTYDANGNRLQTITAPNTVEQTTSSTTYDSRNRPFTHTDGEASLTRIDRDRLGRLLGAANAHATVSRTYDAAGRLTGEAQALVGGPTGSFGYFYDTDGNLFRHTRPDGSFIDYAFNARNLLASVVSDAPPPVATYTYNGRNQISETRIENGLFTAVRGHDAAGRLTGVTHGTLDSTGYTLSADGRRTGITRNGTAESYDYDNARQVIAASIPLSGGTRTNSYLYDPAGNRDLVTTNGLTNDYSANALNEYFGITGFPAVPAHDDNGNLTSGSVLPLGSPSLVSCVFTWDIHNQLSTATNGSGDTASYQYDALGRRTKRVETIGGLTTTTWFFTNGWNVELEHDGSAFTRRMTWGLDLSQTLQGAGGVGGLVMTEALPSGGGAPVPHFPTYDGNGNITAWINAAGTVEARLRYDAFGNLVELTDGSGTPISPAGLPSNYGFSTKPQDRVTGLLYYGYRYYDPVTGRWPSRDPIEEEGGLNLYGFLGNNSLGWTDYLGREVTVPPPIEITGIPILPPDPPPVDGSKIKPDTQCAGIAFRDYKIYTKGQVIEELSHDCRKVPCGTMCEDHEMKFTYAEMKITKWVEKKGSGRKTPKPDEPGIYPGWHLSSGEGVVPQKFGNGPLCSLPATPQPGMIFPGPDLFRGTWSSEFRIEEVTKWECYCCCDLNKNNGYD